MPSASETDDGTRREKTLPDAHAVQERAIRAALVSEDVAARSLLNGCVSARDRGVRKHEAVFRQRADRDDGVVEQHFFPLIPSPGHYEPGLFEDQRLLVQAAEQFGLIRFS